MLHYLRITITLFLLIFAGSAAAADHITVAATFSIIGDMLAEVGGDHIAIRTIVGADSDCDLYQPIVADVATIASARAVRDVGSPSSHATAGDDYPAMWHQPI